MIRTFRHRGLKRLYERGDRSQFRPDLVAKIERILARLEVAGRPEDLDLPGYRLHRLTGDLRGQWAVTVSANYRIVFRFAEGGAEDVDFLDYH